MSVVIAIVSSFSAFGTSERISSSSHWLTKKLWVLFGAISLGIGIWAMHFIGSLALQLPIPVSYNLNITILSVIPAIIGVRYWINAPYGHGCYGAKCQVGLFKTLTF
ncbi:MAG: hypothetical protein GQ532_19725 [Methylomarinum sp.]|nr:hypothetical protein [Methylomarinum sp.]